MLRIDAIIDDPVSPFKRKGALLDMQLAIMALRIILPGKCLVAPPYRAHEWLWLLWIVGQSMGCEIVVAPEHTTALAAGEMATETPATGLNFLHPSILVGGFAELFLRIKHHRRHS